MRSKVIVMKGDYWKYKIIFSGVMGPDEDHEKVDNNFYTNVAFRRVLQFAV